MIRIWAVAVGFAFVNAAQAAQPPPSCQGLLSDPQIHEKVKGAVNYAIIFNRGSEPSPDKVFSDLAHWLEDGLIWLERDSTLYRQLQKIRSEIDSGEMREQITACYPYLDRFLHPEVAKKEAAARQAEAVRQAEASRQAEAAARAEATKRQEEAARQAWMAGAPARGQTEEAARQAWEAGAPARAAEAAKREEAARQTWEAGAPERAARAAKAAEALKRAQEAARQAQAEQARAQEAARQAWEAEAPARAAEAQKQEEAAKQTLAAKQAAAEKKREEAERQAREAEAQARAQAEEARRQANAALEFKLTVAYVDDIIITRCHNERDGDRAASISETQVAKAQVAMSAIEQNLKRPGIDLAALRKQANSLADDNFIWVREMPKAQPGHANSPVEMLCKGALQQLMQLHKSLSIEGTNKGQQF
jgi:chemotaxis protein histidine kinase CheA